MKTPSYVRLSWWTTFSLLGLMFNHAAAAETGSGRIQGQTVARGGEPLEGVSVTLTPATGGEVRIAVSSVTGHFLFSDVPAGAHTIEARVGSLTPLREPVNIAPGETRQMTLSLELQLRDAVLVHAENTRWSTTATRTDTSLLDVPQSISVIPRRVIEEQGTTRVTEMITNASGVIAASGVGGTSENFNVRGLGQFAASQDGIISRVTFGGFDETLNIERVEVLKGPASAIYGLASPGGFVNIVTKRPQGEPDYSAMLRSGSEEYWYGGVDLTGPIGTPRFSYRAVAAREGSGSFREFIESSRTFVATSLQFRPADRTVITLFGEFRDQRVGYDLGIPAVGTSVADVPRERNLGEPWEYADAAQRLGRLFAEHGFGAWVARANVRYRERDFDQLQISGSLGANNRTLTRSALRVSTFTPVRDAVLDLGGHINVRGRLHRILMGLDLDDQDGTTARSATLNAGPIDIFNPVHPATAPPVPSLGAATAANRVGMRGVYAQDQFELGARVSALAGVRHDSVEDRLTGVKTNAWSPRLGLVLRAANRISLYGSYQSSFTPNSGLSFSGLTFEPQRGIQFESGAKIERLGILTWMSVAAFDLRRTNVPTPDPEHAGFNVIVGEQRSRGVEVELTAKPAPPVTITAAYAYIDAETTKDNTIPVGNRLLNVPRHAGRLWATLASSTGFTRGLSASVGFSAQGRITGDTRNTFFAPGAFVLDAALGWERPHIRLALNLKNLTDAHYFRTHVGRTVSPATPRSVLMTMTVRR